MLFGDPIKENNKLIIPQVGNAPWADFIDGLAPRLRVVRVNNGRDPVPIVPGRTLFSIFPSASSDRLLPTRTEFLGYRHPAGELHITAPSEWTVCPGTSLLRLGPPYWPDVAAQD